MLQIAKKKKLSSKIILEIDKFPFLHEFKKIEKFEEKKVSKGFREKIPLSFLRALKLRVYKAQIVTHRISCWQTETSAVPSND